jgi:predicted AAA+ superfamily ATPase
MKFFNTAGPVNRDNHYKIDPLTRWNMDEILTLIEQEKYFILHAPRQTGKTSCLLALRDCLNAEGRYHCVYANFEAGQTARNDVRGNAVILAN